MYLDSKRNTNRVWTYPQLPTGQVPNLSVQTKTDAYLPTHPCIRHPRQYIV